MGDRKSDVYVCMSSYQHNIAADGHYIAVCSAKVEGDLSSYENKEGLAKAELAAALKLLGKVKHTFLWISDYYEPDNDPQKDGCFITSSYDATTHFESCSREVLELYEAIIGEPLDLESTSVDELDE